jgi:amino acid transporter
MNEENRKRDAADAKDAKFGAFKGVFTPSILTILGVIMYLRFGWVVGHGGLLGAVLVVVLAHVISIATGLSILAIATNRKVGTGGDYYMISRSLGLPIGGAIGVALFFALSFSMSLYVLGFAESFLDAFDFDNTLMHRRLVGSIACVALTAITFFSTSLALRIQYVVLAAIGLSLVSLFAGSSDAPPTGPIHLWFGEGTENFEILFAVFFPAVTGFTAGVAMSGDLKDPRKAIPRGTMAAILVGLAVYLAIPVFLSLTVDAEVLREDKMVWTRIAWIPALVVVGVFAATLSSALGSVLGAPRYLQALAMDGVVPSFLGKGYGKLNEPRIGTVATFAIAEAGVLVGELDLIARVITMFFLTSYGFLCLASAVQAWSGIASFRPDFKTPAWVSLIGALTCLAVMFKLDMLAMGGATIVMVLIYLLLKRRQFRASPGDTWWGFWAAVVQKGILHLHKRSMDSRNFRPNALVFGGDPAEREHLVHLARWLFDSRGLATYFYLVEGSIREGRKRALEMEPQIRDEIGEHYPEMLARVSVTPDIYQGIRHASQSYGLSGMTPNTVLMGWGEDSDRPEEFTELVRDLLALDHNLLFLEHDPEQGFGARKRIDVWWGGLERNGALMLLLVYLITSSEKWAHARVRVNVVVDGEDKRFEAATNLAEVLRKARVKAQANVIIRRPEYLPIAEIIAKQSGDADLVLMGLRPPDEGEGGEFVARVSAMIERLKTVLLVRASTRFSGAGVLFEEDD